MKTISKTCYALIFTAIISASCVKETQPQNDFIIRSTFTGIIDEEESKTILMNNGSVVYWEPNDAVNIFCGAESGKFTSMSNTSVLTTKFVGETVFSSAEEQTVFAIYPYSANDSYDGNSATIEVPSAQTASVETFDRNAFVMIAQSNNNILSFKNLCGGVKISVSKEGVNRIVLKGNNNEVLAGKIKVEMIDGIPTVVEVLDGKTEVELVCPSGTFFQKDTWYYISCLPTTLTNGFTIDLYQLKDDCILKGEYNHTTTTSVKRSVWGRVQNVDSAISYEISGSEKAILYQTYNGQLATLYTTQNVAAHYFDDNIGYFVILLSDNCVSLNQCFRETDVESVIIPSCITNIGDYAFYKCRSLTKVTLPSSVTKIGSYAFSNCSSLKNVTIPSSVTSIGSSAFSGCGGLTSVNITDLTSWCNINFSNSSANPLSLYTDGYIFVTRNLYLNGQLIQDLIIPSNVTTIKPYAFYGGKSITSATLPSNVTSIGSYAFSFCSGLTSVTIPSSMTSIGSSAFYECSSLTSVSITDLHSWCNIDFSNSDANPLSRAHNLYLNGQLLQALIIPPDITGIKKYTFYGGSGLTSVTIPPSVTSIGSEAFCGCSGLTSMTLSQGLTSIGSTVFKSCLSLTSVNIPSSVSSIGSSAFEGCTGLTSVNITDLTSWCNIDFSGNDNLSRLRANPLSYAQNLYLNGQLIQDLIIPSNVTTIKPYAFYSCKSITSTTIPSSVASIGRNAFTNCSGLTSITLSQGLTSIGYNAFYKCSSLTSATIPSSVNSIGGGAFEGCTGLSNVDIPSSVTSIGNSAFSDCSGLTSVNITDLHSWCNIDFSDGDANPLSSAHNLYLNGQLIQDLIIPSNVTNIKPYAFYGGKSITSTSLPSSVTSIGKSAFADCSGLISVTVLPTTPPSGGSGMFSGNHSDRMIYVPFDSVTDYVSAPYWSDYASSITYIQ